MRWDDKMECYSDPIYGWIVFAVLAGFFGSIPIFAILAKLGIGEW